MSATPPLLPRRRRRVVVLAALLLSGAAWADYEDSPFGFHPATVPPDISADRYGCAKEVGIRWHRNVVYAFWFLVQPTYDDYADGVFRWERLDRASGFPADGINVLWSLSARNYTQPGSWLPRDMDGFRNYVRAVVERYDGDGEDDAPGSPVVSYWQVENEPNLFRTGPPEEFAELQRAAYEAAKQANPKARILIGGVGGGPGTGPRSSLRGFREYYVPILRKLNGQCIDIFDYHWYGNATGEYRQFGKVYHEVRRALDANGFGDTEIWITEMGSYSGDPAGPHPFQTEQQQAADLVKRYVYPISLGVEKVFWAFGLIESFKHTNGYFDHTGLIYDGRDPHDRGRGVRKLSYWTFKVMTDKLEGRRFVGEVAGLPPNVCGYHFQRLGTDEEPIAVMWWDHFAEPTRPRQKTKPVALRLGYDRALVTSAITDREGRVHTERLEAEDGKLTVRLGEAPVFIEPEEEGD